MSRSPAATPAGRRSSTARAGRAGHRGAAPPPKGAESRAYGGTPTKRTASKRAPVKRLLGGRSSRRGRSGGSRTRGRPARRGARRRLLAIRLPRRRRARAARRPSPWRRRLSLAGALAVALTAGYFLWLRDSSLVAVTDVDVVGVTSGEREQIVAELTEAGEQMTTLHVDAAAMERAAAPFPTIEAVELDPNFPHGLRVEVSERPPTLLARAGGHEVPIASDGTVLEGVPVGEQELPVLELDQIPSGGVLGGEPLAQALVVGAAPEALRPLIEKLGHSDEFGVEVLLRGGIGIRFGSATSAMEKWAAAAAVLADPKLDGLTYLDVRVPERPAAGGAGEQAAITDPQA